MSTDLSFVHLVANASPVVQFVMAILVAGLMVAGWFIANQHQLLQDEQAALESASARIAVLEDRLRVTDEAAICCLARLTSM